MAEAASNAGMNGEPHAVHCNVSDSEESGPRNFSPGLEDRIRKCLAEADFDYALGSVHYLDRGEEFVNV
jgi:hypothetical protein